ncbi:MAG: AraC family transcriptional regulator [Chitinophagaceae bacterium]|nr:AraC family transcriptional regulator [Chitinophagaceae bacterium]
MLSNKKKDGFAGQKAVVIPRKILSRQCARNSIIASLYITDIGFYPHAKFHYRVRAHGSDQYILIYCIDGKGELAIDKKRSSVIGGSFFVIPANMPHTYKADENDPWTIYWIHFKGAQSNAIVDLLINQLNGYIGWLPFNEDRIHLFTDIYAHLEKGYSMDNLTYANMCLWHYLNSFIFSNKFNVTKKTAALNPVEQSVEFMQINIEKFLTLEDIARSVHLSPSHFSSLFKRDTGFPPIEYFNHLKIQKACQFLLFTDLKIKQVAATLGIEDPYYFSRMFTKVMGISPKEYKEKKIH